jgi:hypothetical protein
VEDNDEGTENFWTCDFPNVNCLIIEKNTFPFIHKQKKIIRSVMIVNTSSTIWEEKDGKMEIIMDEIIKYAM